VRKATAVSIAVDELAQESNYQTRIMVMFYNQTGV